jgi:cytochrome b561
MAVRALHWGMLVMYAGMVGAGYWMTGLPMGMTKMKVYALHKSFGILLLMLALLRLVWRSADRRPTAEPSSPLASFLAAGMVVALYGLMFLMPLSGWLYNSAAGFPLRWFSLVNLPGLVASDPGVKALAKAAHAALAIVLIAAVFGHAMAALGHHWVRRDATLKRMWFSRRTLS